MKIKNLIFLLIPAIGIAVFALFLSISQYQPTYEKTVIAQKENINFAAKFPEDPILGNLKAPKEIIAFEDFGCGRCREQMKVFDALLTKYPTQVKIIWKPLDATQFPYSSELAHSYGYCANAQKKFPEFKNNLLNLEDISEDSLKISASQAGLDKNLLNICLQSDEVKNYKEKNRQLAAMLGIKDVPTIFINNKAIQEPLTLAGWETFLSLP